VIWSLRISASKLRPFNAAAIVRVSIVATVVALFLWGDFKLFQRLFRATAQIEAATPFFALGILRNLLAMVFLVAVIVLFSSALTAAIGAFFTDLDLDIFHAAPRSKLRIVMTRWLKALVQSATVVFAFLIPLFIAFEQQYPKPWTFYPVVLIDLALLLTIPVTLASLVIVMLVRWFPVRRVHQIVATLAALVLAVVVIGFRASRPERLFTRITTDDLVTVLRAIELPSIDAYPGTGIAEVMVKTDAPLFPIRIAATAAVLFVLFCAIARPVYFKAFVRARESMAPVAIGSGGLTRWTDRLLARRETPARALIAKEVRTLSRDVAQWSQVFLMGALLFIYLYNVRMLPLAGDARAAVIAYANLGMAGFVVAAVCLRFAYPSISAEGKAFWLVQVAPVSYRDLLLVKVFVYAVPLTAVSILLTAFANIILEATPVIWGFTLTGASLLAFTLVSLGVGLGGWRPNFNLENPLQVGLSLGGFAYMAIALAYVGAMMILMARPLMRFFFWRVFGVAHERAWLAVALPVAAAVTLSAVLSVIPIALATRRLARLRQSS
jgi:ABC-2 type transport system permease protein